MTNELTKYAPVATVLLGAIAKYVSSRRKITSNTSSNGKETLIRQLENMIEQQGKLIGSMRIRIEELEERHHLTDARLLVLTDEYSKAGQRVAQRDRIISGLTERITELTNELAVSRKATR